MPIICRRTTHELVKSYENVIAQGDLPEAMLQSTLKTLSQLYFTIENYEKALATVDQLIVVVSAPSPDVYMLKGQAHFQLQQYRQALAPIKTAIDKYREQGRKPRENWLLLLRVCYYELSDFKNMIAILKQLIVFYPKQTYVLTLAGVYSELGDTKKQLALTEALYDAGLIKRTHQLVNLAQSLSRAQRSLQGREDPANGRSTAAAWKVPSATCACCHRPGIRRGRTRRQFRRWLAPRGCRIRANYSCVWHSPTSISTAGRKRPTRSARDSPRAASNAVTSPTSC